ncbi:MAG TPA: phenylalanine--tRNA ligase subunit beta [Bacteroidales bacterium]|nr:phenylalanine--tRNA ligase subunit beta [Bacteroidales bacterium]HSA43904.1 phenylalanine--tRNA ligase subunit beta [Bacteroidales bacterium]
MKISLNWLKRYVDVDKDADELSMLLTGCGLEVESVENFQTIRGGLEGVITASVITCEKHPDADRLHVTLLDTGSGQPLQVVCGAPNVRAGQIVLLAKVGTSLFKGEESFQIREARIRGVLSQGMICAEDELGLGDSHEGILVLPEDTPVGMAAAAYFNVYTDTIFEIGLTPNRSDAFSHTGVARDLAAVLRTLEPENYRDLMLDWPDIGAFQEGTGDLSIGVQIEDAELCPRYSGLCMTNIKVKDSPQWMQHLLRAAGMRPINNIVDITNFVMLETGQPLHAFDAACIRGSQIIVKRLPANTVFTTLDGTDRILNGEELMICDTAGGLCMAGVYGGLHSGVTEKTSAIFLESACFSPVSIRRTSKYHGLKTDSSQRFERGSNPGMTIYALKRAALLMQEYADAVVSSSVVDVLPVPILPFTVKVSYKNMSRLIGGEIPEATIKDILQWLEIEIKEETTEGLTLSVPPFKTDVRREADIVEEIMRIYGYNRIPMSNEIRYGMIHSGDNRKEKLKNQLADLLSSSGFSEIMCNSLTKADYIKLSGSIQPDSYVHIRNPLSHDLEVMRRTMLYGGLETILHNQNRRTQNLKLYEFGSVYSFNGHAEKTHPLANYSEEEQLALWICGNDVEENWYRKPREADFFFSKMVIHQVLSRAGIRKESLHIRNSSDDLFRQGLAYYVHADDEKALLESGEVAPLILKHFDIKTSVFFTRIDWQHLMALALSRELKYSELPRYPWVRRDLALLLDKSVSFDSIEKLAFETESRLLKKVSLFDVYQGEGIAGDKKSYAVSFILQDLEKTLTDQEVDAVMEKLIRRFGASLQAEIR